MLSKTSLLRTILSLTIVGAVVACTAGVEPGSPPAGQPPIVSHGGPVVDYVSLIDNLRAAGATVEPAGEVSQHFFSVPGQIITVNGADVQVYEYPEADAAKTEAAFISPDGGQATVPGGPVTMIEWIATPHFYRQGRLIVLYVGDDAGVISVLEAVLGPQFAGRVASVPDAEPPAAASPTLESEGQARPLEPLATAARLSFLGWSPDGATLAYLEHTPDDLAVLGPFPPGRLKFLNARTGQICDSTVVFPEGDYYRAGQMTWLPDGTLLVSLNGQTVQGIPCQGEFRPFTDEAGLQEAVREPGLSPDGEHRASTEVSASNGGILSLVTRIATVAGGQVENVVEWQIDERLGDLGLGGQWLTEDTFLIYETLDRGPLLVTPGQGVSQVALDLFGLPSAPSILDPEGVSLRAMAAVVEGTDTYHLILSGVGLEGNFPALRLYHSETGKVEELPFRYTGGPTFSPDGRWLVLEARPIKDGYERPELWLRPADPPGSEARRFTDQNVTLSAWSPDWTQVAGQSPKGVAILTVPDGIQVGVWGLRHYTLVPQAWSPNGEFLAVSGFLPVDQGEALFVIQVKNGSSAQTPGLTAAYTDYLLGLAFDIPAAWGVDGRQGAEGHVILPAETGGGQGILTFSVVGEGDLDFALNEVKRGAWGPHITEVQPVRLGEFEALRLELTPGEGRPPLVWLVVAPSGQAVGFIPAGDPALVEPLLATLRVVPVRELKDLPTATPFACAEAEAELACDALVTFFERLHNAQYQEAADLYGGSYEVLLEYNPDLDPQDQAALLQNACNLNGFQCLRVKSAVLLEQASPTAYTFAVEFENPDGSLFVRRPCCGADEAARPAESQFTFTVLKDSQGRVLVQELPVYIP